MIRYKLREPTHGEIVAVHVREDDPDGTKRMWWELPDGTPGLGGLKVADLPLFGAAGAHRWHVDEPVIIAEGERAAMACVRAGYQAVGTVTGASACPNPAPLAILAAMRCLLWPDNDHAGVMHMLKIANAIRGGVASLGWIVWREAPPGGDAADALAAGGVALLNRLVDDAGAVPAVEEPVRRDPPPRRRTPLASDQSPIDTFNAQVTVSDVLRQDYGVEARPGRAVKCPRHDDKSPSLSVLPDDRRAFCHSPGCELNNAGRGRDAWDLAQLARQAVPA